MFLARQLRPKHIEYTRKTMEYFASLRSDIFLELSGIPAIIRNYKHAVKFRIMSYGYCEP